MSNERVQTASASKGKGSARPTDEDMPGLAGPSTIDETPIVIPAYKCKCSSSGRNIAVFIDGTSNQFGEKNTNILELYAMVIKDVKSQATYYNSGIGTYARPTWRSFKYWKQRLYNLIDTAIAWNFERIVLSAYQWLVENYQPGDCIYLFGFSRGAYQVRVIAGMIEKVGLLHKGNNEQIPFAFELYSDAMEKPSRTDSAEGTRLKKTEQLCKRFKKTLSQPNIKVHFVGVWDTVSSIGVARHPSFPETVTGMKHVCFFRHALALDERRVKFLPEYANGGEGPGVQSSRYDSGLGNIKEVWFAGSHSDIGGGNTPNADLNNFGPALRWMLTEAWLNGLHIGKNQPNWSDLGSNESLTGVWKVLEVWPFRRLTYEGDQETTIRPHCGLPRIIQSGQQVHASVLSKLRSREYFPHTQLAGNATWDDIRDGQHQHLIENDDFESPSAVLERLKKYKAESKLNSFDIFVLGFFTITKSGLRKIAQYPEATDILMSLLDRVPLDRDTSQQPQMAEVLLKAILGAERKYTPRQILEMYQRHRQTKTATTKCELIRKHGHILLEGPFEHHDNASIQHVFFTPDGSTILSGSHKAAVIWACQEKQTTTVLPFPSGNVISATITADGFHAATGSYEGKVEVWDVQNKATVQTFEGGQSRISSLAFSADGCKLAAGSNTGVVQVWNIITGKSLFGQMTGHDFEVDSLAFSPDGSHLVSGSIDHTIRIWDAVSGKELKILKGHAMVMAVTFTADGTQIISGSYNNTLQVWNMGLRKLVRTLRGHQDTVSCVSGSPDQRLIASGSWDRTLRLWNAFSGEMLAVYNVRSSVCSVAFSSDSKQVVTGTEDGEVHVWDADVLL